MRQKYIQFYDENGLEVLGSDGILLYDNRLSDSDAFKKAAEHARKMITLRCLCYARIYCKPIGRGPLVRNTCMLIDPADARWMQRERRALQEDRTHV